MKATIPIPTLKLKFQSEPMVSIIVAMTPEGAIGRNGDLLYHISADLKRFKAVTMGKPLIMGRKTFESLPGGALPGRRNIVVTGQAGYSAPGAEIASSFDEALAMAAGADEVMVIGGATIYRQALSVAGKVYLTLIEARVDDADTFIPPFDEKTWSVEEESSPATDPRSGVVYRFIDLVRR